KAEAEYAKCECIVFQKYRKHAQYTTKKTYDSVSLHPSDEIQTRPQVFYLISYNFTVLLHLAIFRVQVSDQCCKCEKTICVSQHQKCDCRKQQSWCIDGNFLERHVFNRGPVPCLVDRL